MQQLAVVEDDVRDMLRCDVRSVMPGKSSSSPHFVEDHEEDGNTRFVDEWGIGWRMPLDGGLYFDMYHAPMSDVETLEDLKKWEWNDPTDPVRFVNMRSDAYRIVFQEETPYLLGRHFAGIFETSLWLRGIENFLCDLHANPGFAESLLDIITEMKIQYWEKALEAVGDNVMIVTEADDLGTQESLMLSPEMYRRFLRPRHAKIHALTKKKAKKQVKIFFHSCGAIYDIVPDFIESHIDILNPWQVSAHGMLDTKKFK